MTDSELVLFKIGRDERGQEASITYEGKLYETGDMVELPAKYGKYPWTLRADELPTEVENPKKLVPQLEQKAVIEPQVVEPVGNLFYFPGAPTVATRFTGMENVTVVIPMIDNLGGLLVTLDLLSPQLKDSDEIIVSLAVDSRDRVRKTIKKKFPRVTIALSRLPGMAAVRSAGMAAVRTTHSCANVILMRADETPDADFVARMMEGIWAKTQSARVCMYASWVHKSVLTRIAGELSEKHDVFWNPSFGSPENEVELPDAGIYITGSSEHRNRAKFDLKKTLFLMHGLSPAELECFSAHSIQDFLGALLPGPWYLDKIKEGVWGIDFDDYADNFFHLVGWPKGDILFSPELGGRVEEIKESIGIKLPHEKTILYSPTGFWRIGYSSASKTLIPLIEASINLEMNLIVKLHFATNKYSPNTDVCAQAKMWSTYLPNVTWIEPDATGQKMTLDDITPLYDVADILVSDASSTVLEFLQVDKPAIEMMNRGHERDPDAYPSDKTLDDKLEDWRGFAMPEGSTIRCWDSKNLVEKLLRAAYYPQETAALRKKWRKKIFHKLDGRAAERVAEVVGGLL